MNLSPISPMSRQRVRHTAILAIAGAVSFAACGAEPAPGAAGDGIPGVDVPTISAPDTIVLPAAVPASAVPITSPPLTTVETLITAPPVLIPTTLLPPPVPTAPAVTTPVPPISIPTPPVTIPPVTTAPPAPTGTPTDPSATAWVAASGHSGLTAESNGVNCLGFYEAMASVSDEACGPWNANNGEFVWTVTRDVGGIFSGVIWEESELDPFTWHPQLLLTEPSAGTWSSLSIRTADIDGGPNEELVSGIRYAGTGGYLDLDVIDTIAGNPSVVAHASSIDKGIAYTEANAGVWFWNAVYAADDFNCCPSSWSQFLLSAEAGGWTVSDGMVGIAVDDIPHLSEF